MRRSPLYDEALQYATQHFSARGQHMAGVYARWYVQEFEGMAVPPAHSVAYKAWIRIVVH